MIGDEIKGLYHETKWDLFAMVLSLTESWLTAPPALQAAAGDTTSARRLAEHRKAIVEAVRRITEPL